MKTIIMLITLYIFGSVINLGATVLHKMDCKYAERTIKIANASMYLGDVNTAQYNKTIKPHADFIDAQCK